MTTPPVAFLAALIALAACGGDDGQAPDAKTATAADYRGLWLMTELVLDDGSLRTVRRDGVTEALRGDAVFEPTGALTGRLDVRQLLLAHGVPASAVMSTAADVTIEPTRWIVADASGEVTVFITALTGDHLVLTHDGADPRDTAASPPVSVTVDRVAPWSTTMVGEWDLRSITFGDTTVVADTCYSPAAGAWGKLTMLITVDARLHFRRDLVVRQYSDETCTNQLTTSSSTQLGLAEEEGGVRARIWGSEEDRHEYQAFDLAPTGANLVLTRTACLPAPSCEASAPTQVVVRRRP